MAVSLSTGLTMLEVPLKLTPKNLSAVSRSSGLKVVARNWAVEACREGGEIGMRKLKLKHHLYLLADQVGDGGSELGVQGGVHLVEEIEGSGITSLDGEDEGEGHDGLLTTRELLHVLHDPGA